MTTTFAAVAALVARAQANATGTAAAEEVAGIAARLYEPLRVAVAGKAKAGKSTLLNALVGEVLAPTDARECTKVVTWYRDGLTYRATVIGRDASAVHAPLQRTTNGIEVDLGGRSADAVDRIEVEWPARALRTMTLIDTPGVGSLSGAGARAVEFLAPEDDRPCAADAVIYLTRHLHSGDVGFLEAFHDQTSSRTTPVNAIAVLSRADELGGGRPDSLESAARVAARYRGDAMFRRYCLTVVPVAGLLAQAATSFTEGEFRALGRLAQLDDERSEALLVSADRFVDPATAIAELAPDERVHLVERLGLFGVRLGRDLLRHGHADSARRLAEELRRRSGLDELRLLLATSFSERAGLLKARSAIAALDDVFGRHELGDGDGLAVELDRIRSSAADLAELRVLTAVRVGVAGLRDAEVAEIERVLGPGDTLVRLGLERERDDDDVRDAVLRGVTRWRARAESPLSSPAVIEVSQIVTRALEWMLAPQRQGLVDTTGGRDG